MSEVVYTKRGTMHGREVLVEVRSIPGAGLLIDTSIEQEDGSMGRPVSAEGGGRELIKPSQLSHIDNAFDR